MILSSHIIIGTAITASVVSKSPTTGLAVIFLLSFVSHYIVDIIPHWDYKLSSIKQKDENDHSKGYLFTPENGNFWRDITKVLIDITLGLIIGFLLINNLQVPLYNKIFLLLFSAFASLLPDFLQTLHVLWKNRITIAIHKLDRLFHNGRQFKQQLTGPLLQAIAVIIIILLV